MRRASCPRLVRATQWWVRTWIQMPTALPFQGENTGLSPVPWALPRARRCSGPPGRRNISGRRTLTVCRRRLSETSCAVRFADSVPFASGDLGFRCAPSQANHYHPLRGFRTGPVQSRLCSRAANPSPIRVDSRPFAVQRSCLDHAATGDFFSRGGTAFRGPG
jgi:hypothetical protein